MGWLILRGILEMPPGNVVRVTDILDFVHHIGVCQDQMVKLVVDLQATLLVCRAP